MIADVEMFAGEVGHANIVGKSLPIAGNGRYPARMCAALTNGSGMGENFSINLA